MKEKMRALLIKNPDITLPEAARVLNVNERNCKSVRVAYWKARALLYEELTGLSMRALLESEGHKIHNEGPLVINEGHTDILSYEGHNEGHMENEGLQFYRDRKDRMNEEQGPYRDPIHSVSDKEYVAPEEEPKEENEEEITMPQTWRDKGNKLYVKGRISNTWRVYYTDQDYDEIDEEDVEERYTRNDENWYDFKYQDCYYRYDNGEYTRKKEGYLFYEPIDRNKYLSAKVMSSL